MTDARELLADLLAQLQDAELDPETPLVIGERTRCRAKGDTGKAKTGFYVIYEHRNEDRTFYAGAFGSWREGEKGSFHKLKPVGGRMTAEDREVIKARVEAAKKKEAAKQAARHARAGRRAAGIWKTLPERGRSAYLERKQVTALGLRFGRKPGTALVPMRNLHDHIVGMQILFDEPDADGLSKRYWPPGLQKEGAFHLIGPHPEPGEAVLLCEGYATGASLHMATGLCVVVAYDAGNLLPVGKAMRERYPDHEDKWYSD